MLLSLQFVYESRLFYNNLTLETQVELLIPDSCFVLSGTHQWYPACIILRGRANHFELIRFSRLCFQLKRNHVGLPGS